VFWYPAGDDQPQEDNGITVPGYGERWSMMGRIRRWQGGRPGTLPIAHVDWYRSRFLSAGHGSAFLECCFTSRRAAAGRLSLGIDDFPEAVNVVHALLLGYRARLDPRIRDLFADTGTLHVFAISGLHVGMVAGLIIFVLTAFRLSRVYWVLFVGPLLLMYTCATGMKASAVRACIMAITYFSAPLLRRRSDGFSSLAFAALAILVARPSQLFDVGFIFSFVVVIGLISMYPLFEKPLRRLWEPDPLRLQPERRWVKAARGALRYPGSLAALSCSAWLASAPLTATFFERFSPIALVSNVIVIPLAFLIVLAGCLSLVLGSCVSVLAEVFNHANVALVWLLVHGIAVMDAVPCGSCRVPGPPRLLVLLWYAGLACGVMRCRCAAGRDRGGTIRANAS